MDTWQQFAEESQGAQNVVKSTESRSAWKKQNKGVAAVEASTELTMEDVRLKMQVQVPALGRPFSLGMLYDARRDQLVTGFTLWDSETINNQSSRQTQKSSSCEISVSDSFESKSSLMNLNASVKASFLGGLVDVDGSAAYLNDKKKFKNQSRITFQYKATTEYKALENAVLARSSPKVEGSQVRDYSEKSSATHVVTGILYGVNTFFVFDSEKLDSNSVQNIEGSMQAVIKKIPDLAVEGQAELKLSKEEKDVASKYTCKFYGDFILDKNPVTLEDAVNTYTKLPGLLGENGENSVPLNVWLTPLKDLDPSAAELKEQISFGLLRKIRIYLESIREIEMRCNEAQQEKEVMSFPQIHEKFILFENLCKDYIEMLRQTMREKIPLIREGKEDETSLEKFIDQQENSLFSPKSLDNWLDNAEREINVIGSCVGTMEGIQIVPYKNNLDKEVLAEGVDVFCFVFTSVKTDDPFLDQMMNYLSKDKTEPQPCVPPSTKDQWFFSDEVVTNMMKKATEFSSAFKRLKGSSRFHFVVAALPNAKFKGATIYQYRDGLLKTEDFSQPEVPDVTAKLDPRDLLWYYRNLTLDPATCNNRLLLSDENTTATFGTSHPKYPETPQRFKDRPQVLCQQGLTGGCYFEVEWSVKSPNIVWVALAYDSMARKGETFGENKLSWSLGVNNLKFESLHDKKHWSQPLPPEGCSRVGVYLDWSGGSLSFYNVVSNQLIHLYTYKANFTEPLYPGLYLWYSSNFASFRPI
ncbi:stonustoxin subunit alpha-like [Fundulus heteroclitus]|uniref:stonustoxin subunit alpha-like n=1 Tax=Fundulus heteroclitus TaxID=8078 RepID=UPI00165AE851|nr:stonustoxin subunit alpha-like [Fundulus heteroclitus]